MDTQNVRQQTVVSSALLGVLPTGLPSLSTLVTLTAGMTGNPDVGGSAGTFNTQGGAEGLFHGKFGTKVQFDGMRIQNFTSGDSPGYMFNVQAVEEMQMETGGQSAEGSSTGMTMNLVPKDGGNTFKVTVSSVYSNEHTQSDNLSDELRVEVTTSSQKVINVYDFGTTVGGPIRRDKLWFLAGWRKWGSRRQVAWPLLEQNARNDVLYAGLVAARAALRVQSLAPPTLDVAGVATKQGQHFRRYRKQPWRCQPTNNDRKHGA